MNTSSIAFLFNADAPGIPYSYGSVFDAAFLKALSAADSAGRTNSGVFRGDVLVRNLTTKITAVSKGENRSGRQQSYDKNLLSTIIWDLADSLAGQWNTVDQEYFPLILGGGNVHCISVPNLPVELKAEIDERLRDTNGYLGAIEVDLGNPIQRSIFIDWLVKDAVISGGQVILELSWEGFLDTSFNDAQTFHPNGRRLVPYGSLEGLQPPIPTSSTPSPRGLLSLERYEGKREFSLQERVVAALSRERNLKVSTMSYEIGTNDDEHNPLEADLPEAKFVRYLLDPNHIDGGSKAQFFKEALDIEQEDWRYLAAQLHDGLKSAKLSGLGVKSWDGGLGVTFNAVIPVKGRNGRTIDVDSNWIMEPGMQPRLSTAVPAKSAHATGREAIPPSVVDRHLDGDARWSAIFQQATKAGLDAEEATIPTPIFIAGFGIEQEGMSGHAWVRLSDPRNGFTTWLIANGRVSYEQRLGVRIYSAVSSQSIDRARAYALAFARVLKQNGITCEVDSQFT